MSTIEYTNNLGYKHTVHAKIEECDGGVYVTIPGMNRRFIHNYQIIKINKD